MKSHARVITRILIGLLMASMLAVVGAGTAQAAAAPAGPGDWFGAFAYSPSTQNAVSATGQTTTQGDTEGPTILHLMHSQPIKEHYLPTSAPLRARGAHFPKNSFSILSSRSSRSSSLNRARSERLISGSSPA